MMMPVSAVDYNFKPAPEGRVLGPMVVLVFNTHQATPYPMTVASKPDSSSAYDASLCTQGSDITNIGPFEANCSGATNAGV